MVPFQHVIRYFAEHLWIFLLGKEMNLSLPFWPNFHCIKPSLLPFSESRPIPPHLKNHSCISSVLTKL